MTQWFPLLISLLGYVFAALSAPAYVASHPQIAVILGGIATLIAHLLPSPVTVSKPSAQVVKMGAFVVCFLLILGVASPAHAQTVADPLPVNIYAGGVSYNVGGSPAVAGTGLYARLIGSTGTYAFTVADILPNTQNKFTVSTNLGVGIAQKVATIAGVPVYIPTSAGISYTGTNTGWAWSTGGIAVIGIKGTSYKIMPDVRLVKSSVANGSGYQPIIGVLFGWGQ